MGRIRQVDFNELERDVRRLEKRLVGISNEIVSTSNQIITQCFYDDEVGDGSVLTKFTRVVSINQDGVVTSVGDFTTDLTVAYTLVGAPGDVVPCENLGNQFVLTQNRFILSGIGTWDRPDFVESVTVKVKTIGDTGNPPTITDADAVTTALYANDTETWSVAGSAPYQKWLMGNFRVTNNHANDVVIILWTQLE